MPHPEVRQQAPKSPNIGIWRLSFPIAVAVPAAEDHLQREIADLVARDPRFFTARRRHAFCISLSASSQVVFRRGYSCLSPLVKELFPVVPGFLSVHRTIPALSRYGASANPRLCFPFAIPFLIFHPAFLYQLIPFQQEIINESKGPACYDSARDDPGPAIVKILQPIPNTCPSFLYSIAGAAAELASR